MLFKKSLYIVLAIFAHATYCAEINFIELQNAVGRRQRIQQDYLGERASPFPVYTAFSYRKLSQQMDEVTPQHLIPLFHSNRSSKQKLAFCCEPLHGVEAESIEIAAGVISCLFVLAQI